MASTLATEECPHSVPRLAESGRTLYSKGCEGERSGVPCPQLPLPGETGGAGPSIADWCAQILPRCHRRKVGLTRVAALI